VTASSTARGELTCTVLVTSKSLRRVLCMAARGAVKDELMLALPEACA
jgi:hypothetical protein